MFVFYQIFGNVIAPSPLAKFGAVDPTSAAGIGTFLNLIFKLLLVGGGIFGLFNLILAGYAFLSAGDDPKKVEGAWGKIWQTAIGLLFMAGSFVLAAIFGLLIFGDVNAIISPRLPTL